MAPPVACHQCLGGVGIELSEGRIFAEYRHPGQRRNRVADEACREVLSDGRLGWHSGIDEAIGLGQQRPS